MEIVRNRTSRDRDILPCQPGHAKALSAQLLFVVICWNVIILYRIEGALDIGIIAVEIARACPTTTVLPFFFVFV